MSKAPLPLKKLLKILRRYGIETLDRKRGKGSELILLKPNAPGSTKGPQYPIKNHGKSTDVSVPVINAILRRFGIDKDDFWE